ncbi:MAG: helix-hairpin-helix domain-containing protein [Deltaproteobacteria bacterium]|nr:helix-hairpin-helix domain-containing protein [Deltaproteobacteria bacterium]
MPAAQLAALAVPVDLNRASEEELTSLPRIGPVLARRIAQGRPYAGVDALTTVRGIGPVTLERLRSRVVVGPVDP